MPTGGRSRVDGARIVWGVAATLLFCLWTSIGAAHPLGNNTINRLTAIRLAPGHLELRYVMDLAEIPALMQTQAADLDGDGTTSEAEWDVYVRTWARDVSRHLELALDEERLAVELNHPRWLLVPGAAGLFTLRLEATFDVPVSPAVARLRYHDHYEPAQVGWKEISIAAERGVRIQATAPAVDRSKGLTEFPTTSGIGLPQELSASAEIEVPRPEPNAPAVNATRDMPQASVSVSRNGSASPGSNRAGAAVQYEDAPGAVASPAPPPGSTPAILTAGGVAHTQASRASIWRSAGALFRLGVHHIATGWDHLAFLLGLLLLGQSLRQLIKVVTAFTVAHSLTLALAANGWVTPPGSLVESAIALTIAYVGFVSLVWRRSRHSALLAFSFGLVHGFGFAGALAESMGTRAALSGAWLINLASFNLGIETFQLLLICTLVPLMARAARYPWSSAAARLASLGVCSAGVGWFIVRAPQIFG